MAYRRSRRAAPRRSASRGRSYAPARRRTARRTTGRRTSAPAIRLVIETPSASAVARPGMFLKPGPEPKKARF